MHKNVATELSDGGTEVSSERVGRVLAMPLQASVFTGTLANTPAVQLSGKRRAHRCTCRH